MIVVSCAGNEEEEDTEEEEEDTEEEEEDTEEEETDTEEEEVEGARALVGARDLVRGATEAAETGGGWV